MHRRRSFVVNMIENVGLLISAYNEGEDLERAKAHIEGLGLSCFGELALREGSLEAGDLERIAHSFAFTDDREAADQLKAYGIGFVVYDNAHSRASSFRDALYMIDNVCYLTYERIDRFLLRYLRLPWVITETERCIIREMTEEDVAALYEIYADPSITRYTEGLFADVDREREYTREYIENQYRFFEYGMWLIEDKASGKAIGRAGLSNRAGFQEPELGYVIAAPYQRQGFAYEVCTAILRYARRELAIESVNAFTMGENIASVRLLEKLGFREVGENIIDGKVYAGYNLSYE